MLKIIHRLFNQLKMSWLLKTDLFLKYNKTKYWCEKTYVIKIKVI